MLTRRAAGCAVAALLCACTSDNVTVGVQCPAPKSGRATLADPDAGPSFIYGTRCAPCDDGAAKLDARGCPVFVTWASCGGDICIGSQIIPVPGSDAGTDEDGGNQAAGDEDGGQ